MTLHTYPQLQQGSDEWLQARCGILTASTIGRLLTVSTPGADAYDCTECNADAHTPCISLRTGKPNKTMHDARYASAAANAADADPIVSVATGDTARKFTISLAAERITGYIEPTFRSMAMERGVLDEPLARDAYSKHFAPVHELGFMVRDFDGYRIGCSPDGLVGETGMIEIKSRAQAKQVETVIEGDVPAENYAQTQCALLVSGRDWIDYVSFSSGMELWTHRVYPDPAWQSGLLEAAQHFETEAQAIVTRYRESVHGLPLMERVDHFADLTI